MAGGFAGLPREFGRTDPEELTHAARVCLWVRWLVLAFCLFEINYRIEFGAPSHVLNGLYVLGLMAANGWVLFLMRRRHGRVKPLWMFGLNVLDLGAISFSVSLSGGYGSPYFPIYYFMVAMFAWVFAAPRLVLPWTTLVAVIYAVLCVAVEPGMDYATREERNLAYLIVMLYAVSGAVSLMTGFERERRRRGLERERELQRQSIEVSQHIHDTTAQWAYMVGLGWRGHWNWWRSPRRH